MLDRRKGEANSGAKLTEEKVREIRKRHELYWKNRPIVMADEYGVSPDQIRAVVHKKHWKHV